MRQSCFGSCEAIAQTGAGRPVPRWDTVGPTVDNRGGKAVTILSAAAAATAVWRLNRQAVVREEHAAVEAMRLTLD